MSAAMDSSRVIKIGGFWRLCLPDGTVLPNLAGGHTDPSLSQAHFRIRNDNGTEATATWKAAEDTNPSAIAVDENVRVRFTIDETAGGDPVNQSWQAQYNHNGGGWNNITASSSVVRSSASPNVADGAATTRQLTAPAGTFQASQFDEVDGATASLDLSPGNFTEVEYCVQIRSADVVNADTIQLRVVGSTTNPLHNYAVTPTLTVSEATPITVTVNQATETDLAQPLTERKVRAVVQAAEADLAQPVTVASVSIVPVGQALETDLAQAVASRKTQAVVQAAEAGQAQPLTAHKLLMLGIPIEADLAQALTAKKTMPLVQVTETNQVTGVGSVALGGSMATANELDLFDGGRVLTLTLTGRTWVAAGAVFDAVRGDIRAGIVGDLDEIADWDTAKSSIPLGNIVRTSDRVVTITLPALSYDISTPETITATVPEAATAEASGAIPSSNAIVIQTAVRISLGQVTETNAAQPMTAKKTAALGQVTETDTAQPMTLPGATIVPVGQALETDLAQAVASRKTQAVVQAAEAGQAQPLTAHKLLMLGIPIEADLAQALARRKTGGVGRIGETDLAQPLAWNPQHRLVGQALEGDVAQALTVGTGTGFTLVRVRQATGAQPQLAAIVGRR